jgi:hypothetical protein
VELVLQTSVGIIRLINRYQNALNGNTTEVASKEDLVFALRNNILKVNEVAVA